MYDKEKGIYPSGGYLVGRDLPLGGYVFTAKNGQKGCVTLYKSYKDFKEEEMELTYEYFEEDYHLSLMQQYRKYKRKRRDALLFLKNISK